MGALCLGPVPRPCPDSSRPSAPFHPFLHVTHVPEVPGTGPIPLDRAAAAKALAHSRCFAKVQGCQVPGIHEGRAALAMLASAQGGPTETCRLRAPRGGAVRAAGRNQRGRCSCSARPTVWGTSPSRRPDPAALRGSLAWFSSPAIDHARLFPWLAPPSTAWLTAASARRPTMLLPGLPVGHFTLPLAGPGPARHCWAPYFSPPWRRQQNGQAGRPRALAPTSSPPGAPQEATAVASDVGLAGCAPRGCRAEPSLSLRVWGHSYSMDGDKTHPRRQAPPMQVQAVQPWGRGCAGAGGPSAGLTFRLLPSRK